jgi:hypothetical protein
MSGARNREIDVCAAPLDAFARDWFSPASGWVVIT